jgi:hypothetical protein
LHQAEYPNLAKMARDFLAVSGNNTAFLARIYHILILFFDILTATSVPIERVFSGGADLVTHKRCSLGGDVIRACMCLKSWFSIE